MDVRRQARQLGADRVEAVLIDVDEHAVVVLLELLQVGAQGDNLRPRLLVLDLDVELDILVDLADLRLELRLRRLDAALLELRAYGRRELLAREEGEAALQAAKVALGPARRQRDRGARGIEGRERRDRVLDLALQAVRLAAQATDRSLLPTVVADPLLPQLRGLIQARAHGVVVARQVIGAEPAVAVVDGARVGEELRAPSDLLPVPIGLRCDPLALGLVRLLVGDALALSGAVVCGLLAALARRGRGELGLRLEILHLLEVIEVLLSRPGALVELLLVLRVGPVALRLGAPLIVTDLCDPLFLPDVLGLREVLEVLLPLGLALRQARSVGGVRLVALLLDLVLTGLLVLDGLLGRRLARIVLSLDRILGGLRAPLLLSDLLRRHVALDRVEVLVDRLDGLRHVEHVGIAGDILAWLQLAHAAHDGRQRLVRPAEVRVGHLRPAVDRIHDRVDLLARLGQVVAEYRAAPRVAALPQVTETLVDLLGRLEHLGAPCAGGLPGGLLRGDLLLVDLLDRQLAVLPDVIGDVLRHAIGVLLEVLAGLLAGILRAGDDLLADRLAHPLEGLLVVQRPAELVGDVLLRPAHDRQDLDIRCAGPIPACSHPRPTPTLRASAAT